VNTTSAPDAQTFGPLSAVPDAGEPLLRVRNIVKEFPITQGIVFRRQIGAVHAVNDVSFDVYPRETFGLVGESGCGKSTAARVVTRLVDLTSGSVVFEGREIARLNHREMRPVRRDIQMIFQDPYSSLNPRHTVGRIIGAPFEIQGIKTAKGVRDEVRSLMDRVGLNPEHYNRFPHEFSGGQRQRIGVARALALHPKLIVCDEPVSALDVSIQAQVVNLLEDLQAEFGIAYIFIAHDLSVVRQVSDRVAVMYLGRVMEMAAADDLYSGPRHPYTKALLSAVPVPDPKVREGRERIILRGDLPSPANPPSGCVFRTRCWKAQDKCAEVVPPLADIEPDHLVACHFPEPAPTPASLTPPPAG